MSINGLNTLKFKYLKHKLNYFLIIVMEVIVIMKSPPPPTHTFVEHPFA